MQAIRMERHFGDRVLRCFADRPADINAMWREAVRRHPHGEALVCGARRLDWAAFEEQVLRAAAGLQSLGVRRGDRVALLLGNDLEFVVTCYAVLAAGAVIVPLSTREQTPGLAYILQNSGACVLVHDVSVADRVPAPKEATALRHRVVAGSAPGEPCGFSPMLEHEPLAECVPVSQDDVALIMYTSGTTGLPKGAMLTHLNVVHSVLHYAKALGLDDTVRVGVPVPMTHVTGLVALMMLGIGLGGTVIVVPHFKAAQFLRLAAAERMSFTIMVPAMYKLCLLQDDFAQHDLSAWKVGGYGGAPMPPETIDHLARELPWLRLSNCYGATETTSPVSVMPAELTHDHINSVGLALPCADIVVMDDDGIEVPAGEVGELWLKGPMVVKGYWENPDATRESFVGGYWRSGDMGRVDADGFVYVVDRRKDMLNRGGYKIFSVEIENTLCEHPDVLEAAVVGKPCPVLGERVHVFVAAREGRTLDAEALRRFCSDRLSDYKVPESFTLRSEPLPRNANGKVLKRELREELLASLK